MLLQIRDLNVHYGTIHAVKNLNLELNPGEIVSVVGANGAGKSSLLKAISGLIPSKGSIEFGGKSLNATTAGGSNGVKPEDRVKMGLVQVPEGRGIFLNLSVLENLKLGGWTSSLSKAEYEKRASEVFAFFPRVKERLAQSAGTLSGGEQQMLAIGRAWMAGPKVLLLDEPSLGLAPQFIETIFEVIQSVNKKGTSVLLIEQNAEQALQIAHRGIVLETGSLILQGKGSDLLNSEEMQKSYLGY
jgi:branched-chain amino acid transport system ATP-binding protein